MTDNVDDTLRDRWRRKQSERHPDREVPHKGGGDSGGPHMPDMEVLQARVAAVETCLGEVRSRLDKVDDRLRGVEGDFREVKATLAGISTQLKTLNDKLPTIGQITLYAGGLVAFMTGLLTLVFWFGAHHP